MFLLAAEESSRKFVDLDVPTWAWGALLATIAAMLAVDLLIHRGNHEPTPRRAAIESAVWISFGISFTAVMAIAFGGAAAGEYISGYLIEKSLSVDNVFVWAIIFSTFAIPLKYQHRVLFWGIFGALVLRAIFIFAGVALIDRFRFTLLVFGAFLVYTGFKVLRHTDDEDGMHGGDKAAKLLEKFIPVTNKLDGHHFFTMQNGKRFATPLLSTLIVVEFTDVIFAVDSVPAVLAVSHEPFIVFSSNAFAILGLRAAYFLLAGWKERFHYLSHALGAILIFVGIKMTLTLWHIHMPTVISLGVIIALLTGGIVASLRREKNHQHLHAPEGAAVAGNQVDPEDLDPDDLKSTAQD